MKKEIVKISFLPQTNLVDGSVHRIGFSVSPKLWDIFIDALRTEAALEKEYYRSLYLSAHIDRCQNIRFINLTQRDFFRSWLMKLPAKQLDVDPKRAYYDANAYVVIKNV